MWPMANPAMWEPPQPLDLVRWPLPHQKALGRFLVRALALLARRHVLTIHGLEHIAVARDPFILALNHSTMIESLIVPALLVLHRDGHLIHFLADWNYRLIPGVGLIYARAETITVTRKPARPRILNALKPLYRHPLSALDRARLRLAAGQSVGICPEGKVNRDPRQLLPAHRGAALAERLGELGEKDTADGIRAAAGRIRNDYVHRPRGPIGLCRGQTNEWRRDRYCGAGEHTTPRRSDAIQAPLPSIRFRESRFPPPRL
jgi:Acyltransferase